MIVLFFVVKTISDLSLLVRPSENRRWIEMNIAGVHIGADDISGSNVEPYAGLCFIFLFYSCTISNRVVKAF